MANTILKCCPCRKLFCTKPSHQPCDNCGKRLVRHDSYELFSCKFDLHLKKKLQDLKEIKING